MKKLSKGKVSLIVLSSLFGAFFLYALICCAVTFIPLINLSDIDTEACGQGENPLETITLANDVKLYAFPDGNIRDKYVVVCPGGDYSDCNVETEGFPVATELNRLGYPAFVLEYRTGDHITTAKAPLDDLANAIRYIDEHARQYKISKGHCVLCGFSAGGNLAGLFGTKQYGYANYEGIHAPDSIVLATLGRARPLLPLTATSPTMSITRS